MIQDEIENLKQYDRCRHQRLTGALAVKEKIKVSIPIKYNAAQEIHDGTDPLVIIGPNGSGKTRYGLQVAQWNGAETIAALRNIALEQNIPMQSLSQAEQELTIHKNQRRKRPWSISSEINNLFAKLMAEDSAAAVEFRDSYQHGAKPATTKLMRLQETWQKLFPGRRIAFGGYSPKVTSEYVAGEQAYPAQSMSDGERVALYLAGRVLDASPGVIVVDEPEVHFHSRLAMRFWDELERLRSDCRLVYITHDLQFAQSRNASGYLIVKPGVDPQILSVDEGMPPTVAEEILAAASFSIYANRVVFCEGAESSYDQAILRAYFNNRRDAVVPVGSCGDVIKCTEAFSDSTIVQGMTAIGIVDRDYWPDAYLESLPECVHVLPVHEIESLFCHKSIFVSLARHLGRSEGDAQSLYGDFLSEASAKFTGSLKHKQISERFKNRCVDQFNRAVNSLRVSDDIVAMKQNHEESLAPASWSSPPVTILDEETTVVESALSNPEENLIRVLPGKVYLSTMLNKLGIDKSALVELMTNSLSAKEGEELFSLGQKLRAALDVILPSGQQEDSPDAYGAGDP